MRTDDDMRGLLQRLAPDPPRSLTGADIRGRADIASGTPRAVAGRRLLLPAVAVLAVVALAVAIVVIANLFGGDAPAGDRTSRPIAPASSHPAPTSMARRSDGHCRTSQLQAGVYRRGSTASAPFIEVAVRNAADTRCTVRGYPRVRLFASGHAIPASFTHGTYEIPASPPRTVILGPGKSAYFTIGTSTGTTGPGTTTYLVSTIAVTPADDTGTLTIANAALGASGKTGGPMSVGLTPFVGSPQ
jgi:hypothetical protein